MHPGHSVLQVPVPALEEFVRARHAHHDTAFVSDDPGFVHAHVTVLGPFLPEVDDAAAEVVAAVVASVEPFVFRLERIETFPDGLLHLVPEPDDAFRTLTARLWEAFPQCPPYAGAHLDVRPHLTLDQVSGSVSLASTRALLGDVLPARCVADRVVLSWWESGRTRDLRSWGLGARPQGAV